MSSGTVQEYIAGRLKRLAEIGLKFDYVVEDELHWLMSEHGYFGSHLTADELNNFLSGIEYGIQFCKPKISDLVAWVRGYDKKLLYQTGGLRYVENAEKLLK